MESPKKRGENWRDRRSLLCYSQSLEGREPKESSRFDQADQVAAQVPEEKGEGGVHSQKQLEMVMKG